ncbi:methyl-accepting chemotaxis protein [Spirochaetia bacterium]|nr:methyl-accepting chemotaxis protein [Spirochaetia bacterium]
MKLVKRMSVLIGVLVLAISAIIGVMASIMASNIIKKLIYQSLSNQAGAGAELIQRYIASDLNILNELATRVRTKTMDWDTQRSSLIDDVDRVGFLDIAVVTPDGIARYIKDNTTSDLANRDYIMAALSGKQAVSDVIISRVINKPVLMFAVPITDSAGKKTVGALIGRKDATALTEITSNLNLENSYFPDSRIVIINKEGVITAHPDTNLVLTQFNPIKEAEKNKAYADFAAALGTVITQDSGIVSYLYLDSDEIAAFQPIRGTLWKILIIVNHSDFMHGINQLILYILIVTAVLLILGIGVAFFIGRSIAKPIITVAGTLKQISSGKCDLTSQITINSKDEIGDLAEYFNKTMRKIKNLVTVIKNQATALEQIGDDLSLNMNTTTQETNAISSNIKGIKERVTRQGGSVNQTNEEVDNITISAGKLNEEVAVQAASVEKSTAAIEQMLASIQEVAKTLVQNEENVNVLAQASEVGRSSLQGVAADIGEIARESEGLLAINAVIQGIASQTNLLSMNAAIEAAHAGESGRGFAVVADEIRKLAENSSKQSKIISDALKKITGAINKITLSTDEVLGKFEAIESGIKTVAEQETHIRLSMEEQNAGSKQILEAVSQVNTSTQGVKSRMVEMLDGSRKIKGEGGMLESITTEINKDVGEMAISATEIEEAVNNVNELSKTNKERIEALVKEVSLFKVDGAIKQYRWVRTLSIGNELIDFQHQELFKRINTLFRAMGNGKNDELKQALDFLTEYTIKHFFEEEQIQKQSKYPDFENHHKMHEAFKLTVRNLAHELIMKGSSDELVKRTEQEIAGWLITHITHVDIKLGAYLKEQKKQQQ